MGEQNPRFKCVYTTSGMFSAEMIRLLLQSFDIPVWIVPESAGIAYGLTVAPMGAVDIMVAEENVEKAEEILRKYENGELSVNDEQDESTSNNDNENPTP